MNTQQTLTALAIAASAWTSAAHAQSPTAVNLLGTPDDGMLCRSGYDPIFGKNKLICQKTLELKVPLGCNDTRFPNKVVRANAPGTPNGLDVCDKAGGVNITATNDITSFNEGSDYVFAKADDAKIAERIASQRQTEASALGLSLPEVDAVFVRALTNTTSGDSEDKSRVQYGLFTFPVKTTGGVIAGPSNPSPAVFSPRALPR